MMLKNNKKKRRLRLFLRRLKDVAYAAEDVLDEFGYQTTRLKVTNSKMSYFLHSISVPFKSKKAKKIQKTNMESDEIKRRDAEKSEIVTMLTTSDNEDILSVLPIVGIGGLGKTTLAQLVYNDGLVVKYFDKRVWIHVSRDFDDKKILTDITKSRILKDALTGKRFLLVLDDVWNDDSEQWDMLKTSLKIGARGNKIIVTTRIVEVASIVGTIAPHHLKNLSKANCRSILKNRAFGNGGAEETPKMVAIGKEILQKCAGVPLAAKTLGGLMHTKKDEQEWLSIKNSEIWALPMDKYGILPVLKLSYDHLVSPLKQCFLYCSIFPKDAYIFKNDLIQQWMALGFLQPSIEGRSMKDIGNDYVNSLLCNSLFQNAEKDGFGKVEKFKMHDLVFDLARSLSTSLTINVLDILFKKFKHLRVLHLRNCGIEELPSSIKKLKHLRYLNLRDNPIEALPESITSIYHLQTLDLHNSSK
ncbi:putative disease resistance protein RGA4 [Telopea speciosissima]|uniref:putative disease resistance protein RGA4 n=1 Tax=Telopea speciosissima TaxID=54955 RepID=UPI001CC67503|nr:putative disease resistance protein RGA4 [Telopea speciosissima]